MGELINFWTIIVGVLVFTIGQFILKNFIEPLREFKKQQAVLTSKLFSLRGEIYLTDNENINWFETYKELQNYLSDYIAFYSIIPFKKIIPFKRLIIGIPNGKQMTTIINSFHFVISAPLSRKQLQNTSGNQKHDQHFRDSMILLQSYFGFEFPEHRGKKLWEKNSSNFFSKFKIKLKKIK